MQSASSIDPEEFSYPLPEERIAKHPLRDRAESKLLYYRDGALGESLFKGIPSLLPSKSMLVFNETRVIQARLHFKKESGALIEIFCLEPHNPSDYSQSFGSHETCEWKCLVGNAKRWKGGKLELKIQLRNQVVHLYVERTAHEGSSHVLRFSWDDPQVSFAELLESAGEVPLPPYLNRPAEKADKDRYQTVYARLDGSVAAPTAGLHFTGRLLDECKERGISLQKLCLHVGAGTFKPVQVKDLRQHEMHTEHFSVERDLVAALLLHEGPVVAVGTTSLRTLESLWQLGKQLIHQGGSFKTGRKVEQWNALQAQEPGRKECLEALMEWFDREGKDNLQASTQIMITPGYRFRLTDMLITNFHQPRSTLLMLIAAFIGSDWKKVYQYALENDFRFLSYGDSSLLYRGN